MNTAAAATIKINCGKRRPMGFGSYLPSATPTGSWWLAAAATWEMAGWV
ncbi:hypothetical protein L195_g011481 [Trifolium pratense]|uniref:Uncharacterized protein n=1 Tax=Trifolium pratense TaxID=57577 RepID=A0A2K3PHR2_TRIPR|nr:hypothetical protein L195_g011481 [Trifolium pratense]